MGREIDWRTPEYSAQFTLMVRAVHIKYRDGEGKNWGREMVEYTLHSTLICLMDREAFKYSTDGRVRDRIRTWDEKTQTIRPGRDRGREGRGRTRENGRLQWPGWCIADDKLNGASFPQRCSPHCTCLDPFSLSSALYIPLSLGTIVIMYAWRRLIILPSHCVNINKTGLFGYYRRPSLPLLCQSIC